MFGLFKKKAKDPLDSASGAQEAALSTLITYLDKERALVSEITQVSAGTLSGQDVARQFRAEFEFLMLGCAYSAQQVSRFDMAALNAMFGYDLDPSDAHDHADIGYERGVKRTEMDYARQAQRLFPSLPRDALAEHPSEFLQELVTLDLIHGTALAQASIQLASLMMGAFVHIDGSQLARSQFRMAYLHEMTERVEAETERRKQQQQDSATPEEGPWAGSATHSPPQAVNTILKALNAMPEFWAQTFQKLYPPEERDEVSPTLVIRHMLVVLKAIVASGSAVTDEDAEIILGVELNASTTSRQEAQTYLQQWLGGRTPQEALTEVIVPGYVRRALITEQVWSSEAATIAEVVANYYQVLDLLMREAVSLGHHQPERQAFREEVQSLMKDHLANARTLVADELHHDGQPTPYTSGRRRPEDFNLLPETSSDPLGPYAPAVAAWSEAITEAQQLRQSALVMLTQLVREGRYLSIVDAVHDFDGVVVELGTLLAAEGEQGIGAVETGIINAGMNRQGTAEHYRRVSSWLTCQPQPTTLPRPIRRMMESDLASGNQDEQAGMLFLALLRTALTFVEPALDPSQRRRTLFLLLVRAYGRGVASGRHTSTICGDVLGDSRGIQGDADHHEASNFLDA